MNMLKLSVRNLKAKPLATILSLVLLVLGIGLISLMLQVNKQVSTQLTNNIEGIDMVVGAKGSPLQLVLSSVLQADVPTGNISFSELKKLKKNPFVKKAIPVSYGDNFMGFRILGSSHQYPEIYNSTLSSGRLWNEPFEVTIGATVAEKLKLKLGDTFESSHGLVAAAIETHEHDFKVVGIFANSNSVLDNLILTDLESIWEVHETEHQVGEEEKEITSILITFRNPMGLVQLPRMINQNTTMQAAIPSYEVDRLSKLMGFGTKTLIYIAISIMFISGLSIFISLYKAVSERKYELALMRTYGASQAQVLWSVLLEGIILTMVGFILGILLSRLGLYLVSSFMEDSFNYNLNPFYFLIEETWLFLIVLLMGVLASFLATIRIFKLDISGVLANR